MQTLTSPTATVRNNQQQHHLVQQQHLGCAASCRNPWFNNILGGKDATTAIRPHQHRGLGSSSATRVDDLNGGVNDRHLNKHLWLKLQKCCSNRALHSICHQWSSYHPQRAIVIVHHPEQLSKAPKAPAVKQFDLCFTSIFAFFNVCSASNLEPRFGNHNLQTLGFVNPPNGFHGIGF